MQLAFDSLPCHKRASFLSDKIKTKLIESLKYVIEFNRDSLEPYYFHWQEMLKKLKTESKISSLFFALNSHLIEATNNQTIHTFKDSVVEFLEIPTITNIRYFHFQSSTDNRFKNELFQKYIIFDLPPEAKISDPSSADVAIIESLITQALQLINSCDTAFYKEILAYVNECMILNLDIIKGGTSFNLFGMIFIDSKNAQASVINMIDHLIHETAHLYLFALGVDDALVLNEYEDKFFSPIKNKDRPMLGVYHAGFVLSRVVNFFRLLVQTSPSLCTSIELIEVNMLIEKYRKMAFDSFKIVREHGILTPLGKQMIESAENEMNYVAVA